MHTESAYDGWTAYCYNEQGMVDRLLRVHIQSRRAFGPWWTLSYNMGSVNVAGSVCVHESPGNLALATVVSDRCIAAPVAALALADRWCSRRR